MNRPTWALLAVSLLAAGLIHAEPLTLTCPEGKTVSCHALDDAETAGRPIVSGGCGPITLFYRDSVLAPDTLLVRIWAAGDTCGNEEVCFQVLTLSRLVPRVAVLPLENLSSAEEGSRVMQRLLEDALSGAEGATLISPAKVDDAIMRGRIRQPILMDDDQRQRLSETLGADYFLVGSLLNYNIYQDQYSGPIPQISATLQLQRAGDGKTVWSESLHAVGNDGEWLFALGVEHDITRLGGELARKAAGAFYRILHDLPCAGAR